MLLSYRRACVKDSESATPGLGMQRNDLYMIFRNLQ